MNPDPHVTPPDSNAELLRQLERRIARIETRLALEPMADTPPAPTSAAAAESKEATVSSAAEFVADTAPSGEDLEFEVGQNWFAKIGIAALAVGVAFLLSLPFAGYPAWLPSLAGYALAGLLAVLAHFGRASFELVARYFRGAAMLLLYFATLRLFFFGAVHVLETSSPLGRVLLLAAAAGGLGIALHLRSPHLFGLAVAMGFTTALAVGTPWFLFGVITAVAAAVVVVCRGNSWPALPVLGSVLAYVTYTLWAIGNPALGNPVTVVTAPLAGPFFVLGWVALFAVGSALRSNRSAEDAATQIGTLLNCGVGYLVFLLHTLVGFETAFMVCHVIASVVLLGLAILFWVRERDQFATFIYAMTGYMALSVALIKVSSPPDLFVWLSLESLVVLTTAIAFRSRFIVVANFLIFVAIVFAYVALAKSESGISIGFGAVALISARVLNWKKERLELKTELMRNAYLASAFLVFPYALYHLVPSSFVVPAWTGIAVFYYVVNLAIRNPKYRWMGHGTLLLTAAYALVVGLRHLDATQRIISFLVLGTILLVVSLIFTRVRAGRQPRGDQSVDG